MMDVRRSIALFFFYATALTFVACRRESLAPSVDRTAESKPTTTAVTAEPVDARTARVDTTVAMRPSVVSRAALGSKTGGADGGVLESKTTFATKDPVRLSMWLTEAPEGLMVAARWLDEEGKEVSVQSQPGEKGKPMTFTLDKKLKPGKYRVEGYWGDNIVAEYDFTVN